MSYHITSHHIISHHIIYFPSINPYRITYSVCSVVQWQVSCPTVAWQNYGPMKWYKYVCMYVCRKRILLLSDTRLTVPLQWYDVTLLIFHIYLPLSALISSNLLNGIVSLGWRLLQIRTAIDRCSTIPEFILPLKGPCTNYSFITKDILQHL